MFHWDGRGCATTPFFCDESSPNHSKTMNVLRNKINDQIDEIASFLGLVSTVDRNEIPLQSFRKVERSLIKGIYIAFSKAV